MRWRGKKTANYAWHFQNSFADAEGEVRRRKSSGGWMLVDIVMVTFALNKL